MRLVILTLEQQETLAAALEEAALRVRQSIPETCEVEVEDDVDRINVGRGGKDQWIPGMQSPVRRRFDIEW